MKKILISLSIIGAVAAVATGVTIGLFSDTETSAGNIFTAGTMDLKVDHVRQTYNDVDCKTCSVTLISDPTNMVVEKFDVPITPYPAVYAWVHPAWTAQNDPELSAAGARWIWEANPTKQEDTNNNVTYTFEKDFEWWGPIVSTDLFMAVGSDNSVEVWLNGTKIGENLGEYGYRQESMLHIPAASITPYILQGNNVLKFIVKNWALENSTPFTNPAGLIYKFSIDGKCGDEYFRTHCKLWGEKDLAPGDTFFNFDDVKPGDWGTNIISMHVFSNDAYSCLLVTNPQDNENTWVDAEKKAGDVTPDVGELSQFLSAVLWSDTNSDKQYNAGEPILYGPAALKDMKNMTYLPLTATTTAYVGLAWCLGTQTVDGAGIHCSGVGNQDVSQTDSFLASLTAFAEQQRNNPNFLCSEVHLPQ
jgi:predicted ribosomally synthesized peptide with SipW-like signal peptide